jgi:predicted transcriptional regulator of viral defense system
LGAEEAKLVLALASEGRTVVTPAQAIEVLGDEARARGALRRLLTKGWLQRARGAHYVLLPPEWGAEKIEDFDLYVLASASVDRGYIGWWSAASRHGFTTQVPQVILVGTDRQIPAREIVGTTVRYIKVLPRKFFGWEDMASSGRSFRISSPEKTLVDCVDRPDLCGGVTELTRIVSRGSENVDDEVLAEIAIKHGSISVCQRLGYLLDLTSPDFLGKRARIRLREFIPASARSVLGRKERSPGDVGYVQEWGLLVHSSESDLLAEAPSFSAGAKR